MGSAASSGNGDEAVPQEPPPMSASFAPDRKKQPDASDVQTLDQAAIELERYAHLLPLFREGLLAASKKEISRARKMVKEYTQKGPEGSAELLAEAEKMGLEIGPLLEDDEDGMTPDDKRKKIDELQKAKAKAVKAREFEQAGKLHTQIEALEGRTGDPEAELVRIRKCKKLADRLKLKGADLGKEIEGKVREALFSDAALIKKQKDRYMKARQPLLQYITRFTENKMKVANPVDRFKEKGGGLPEGGDDDEGDED